MNEYFPEAMKKSIIQMPRKDIILEALYDAGFREIGRERYDIRNDLQDFFLYFGKHKPELYLDPLGRQGSSTFSSLANPREIENGCARLREDISSGRIHKIIGSYTNRQEGDYLLIFGKK